MERVLSKTLEFVMFIVAVAVILICLLAFSYVIGICAGAVHLGYEWAAS